MTHVAVFAAVGMGTLLMRASFIVNPRLVLPAGMANVVEHARPAILAALVIGFLTSSAETTTPWTVVSVLTTGLVMRRSRNMLAALGAGVAVLLAASIVR